VKKESAKEKALETRKLAMREAAKAKADAARQEWIAKKGGGAAASEVADAKPAKKTTNILAPLEPIAPLGQVKAEEPIPAEAMNITATGNNGELRSEQPGQK
ncbi:L,D-transpeptidase, partial [Mesorhizobium sp. M8A.F.Ca.ET.198.01.1.1]